MSKDPLAHWARLHWVTTKQASAYLQISTRTLARYVQEGLIRPYRVDSKASAVRFRRIDVEGLLSPQVVADLPDDLGELEQEDPT